jgi:hypothetical protein
MNLELTCTNWTVRALLPVEDRKLAKVVEVHVKVHSPTPPEPRITILYSRILEILADFRFVLGSRRKKPVVSAPYPLIHW